MCTTIPRSHGQLVQLKWHKLHRHAGEPAMLRTNLEAGFQAGAVMEADIRLTRDGQWVCLHDELLDEETSGSGSVSDYTAAELSRMFMRSSSGGVSDVPLMFLDELVEVARNWSLSSAEVQLDLKAEASEIDDAILARFADQIGPVRSSFSLSGSDVEALTRLRQAAPGLPVTLSSSGRLGGARDAVVFESRMESVLSLLDGASMVWVNHSVLQAAYRTRFDLVGFARRRGIGVDTGTIDVGAPGWRGALVLALQANVSRITTNTPCEVAEQVARWTGAPRQHRLVAAS